MSGDPQLTRRAVLLGSLAAAVAACRPHRSRGSAASAPGANPDAEALREAIAEEEKLLLTLNRLADVGDVREKEQGVHADHLVALHQALGTVGATASPTSPAPEPSENASKSALQHRFDQERSASGRRLRARALAASRGSDAALLASIAACHSAPEASDGAQFYGAQQ
jgi:hypothetical protein